MQKLLLIDSGTTNTRVRLTENGNVVKTLRREAGARDGRTALRKSLKALFEEAEAFKAEAAVLSGMITSPTGLLEIPHNPGPLSLTGIFPVRHDFPELTRLPLCFIPGVRLGSPGDPIPEGDIIRGEETELAGYLTLYGENRKRLFFHLGSHHKLMRTDGDMLTRSATALTGELLSAVAEHTLISSSLKLQNDYDPLYAEKGAAAVENEGLARALFLLRIMDTREHLPPEALMGWALGALAREDISMLTPAFTEGVTEAVLYGRENFAEVLAPMLERACPRLQVRILNDAESDAMAPAGAARIYRNMEDQL